MVNLTNAVNGLANDSNIYIDSVLIKFIIKEGDVTALYSAKTDSNGNNVPVFLARVKESPEVVKLRILKYWYNKDHQEVKKFMEENNLTEKDFYHLT
jgi:hypothetical protein